MQRSAKIDRREKQMDPYPLPEDLVRGPMIPGHGIIGSYHDTTRGILVTVNMLKLRGVRIGKRERAAIPSIQGELIIDRVHDRLLDFQRRARIVTFGEYNFPSSQATLLEPQLFAADERGMVLYGFEKLEVEGGGHASFQQAWLVRFGKVAPEPPP